MDKPNYGIDALPVVRNLALVGLTGVVLSSLSFFVGFLGGFRPMFISFAVSFLITAILMILYAWVGKFRHRDRMLNMIVWRGDETVLDVGTGRGLLMIGAAKRLESGKSVGIDIWNTADLSGNNIENALQNAEIEGVASKVEIKNEDVRQTSFADETFDVVLSNLCLHNIPDDTGPKKACVEIARIMKPGAVGIISDFKSTKLYENSFREAGFKTERTGPYLFDTFPPLRILRVQKEAIAPSRET